MKLRFFHVPCLRDSKPRNYQILGFDRYFDREYWYETKPDFVCTLDGVADIRCLIPFICGCLMPAATRTYTSSRATQLFRQYMVQCVTLSEKQRAAAENANICMETNEYRTYEYTSASEGVFLFNGHQDCQEEEEEGEEVPQIRCFWQKNTRSFVVSAARERPTCLPRKACRLRHSSAPGSSSWKQCCCRMRPSR